MRLVFCVALLLVVGCASAHRPTEAAPAAHAAAPPDTAPPAWIIYQRTGGIAGTDDRVVIWPDGLVQVRGTILTSGEGWINQDKLAELRALSADVAAIASVPLPKQPVPDAYMISLNCNLLKSWGG